MTKKNNELTADSSFSEIKGFGPKKTEILNKLGLLRLGDIFEYYPRAYEDRRNFKQICSLQNEEKALVKAKVLRASFGKGYGKNRTLHVLAEDDTGRISIFFFNAGFMSRAFSPGKDYCFFGKVKKENGSPVMFHPSYSAASEEELAGIVPVYPLSFGLNQKDFRKLAKLAIGLQKDEDETLPLSVIKGSGLCPRSFAISNIHFPKGETEYRQARYRLIYEEFFDLKTALLLSSDFGRSKDNGIVFSGDYAKEFVSKLSYELTSAQKRVLCEVISDMQSEKIMNRLVQGDVGSGKTVIAEAALFQAVSCGYQGAFMAPTEILAKQHFENLSSDFSGFNVNIVLLTGALSAKEKKTALEKISSGEAQIIVGTHALISDAVTYSRLGLVITDEQHRFGVSQRKNLETKGSFPDVLIMTATPIPRTLAVVLYAGLDISKIDELPKGRKKIVTRAYENAERSKAYRLLIEEINKGRQAYIVAPFIDDSDSIEGASVVSLFEEFCVKYPHVSCSLLYGSMKQSEKDSIMEDFYKGNISVLISTVVIEVGINVPNATVMIIEASERFGLAQLHQLRGRVGRGGFESHCMLIVGGDSEIAKERAKIMCSTSDGFVIADKDLEMRGPGEFFGFAQHGIPQLVLADPIRHSELAKKAEEAAIRLLADDPKLSKEENSSLKKVIDTKFLSFGQLTI